MGKDVFADKSPKEIAQLYTLTNLFGFSNEKLGMAIEVINSGAFYHLTFEDKVELDKVITENIGVNPNKNYGINRNGRLTYEFQNDKIKELDPTQVYYFLKDGIYFDRFLAKRVEEETFRRVYKDSNELKGDLYLQHIVINRAKKYSYFIGEELAYLLAVKSNELLLSMLTYGFSRKVRQEFYKRYLDECFLPYVETIKDGYRLTTRGIASRDVFKEFEEGRIGNRGRVNLKVKNPTLKERVVTIIQNHF